ncbi:polyhydroxyalkanoate depolymerase [Pelagerythrobacter marensis]|uniref:Polyhydroxyalkanoate depolymerase n=2 Tax=Pelagerythrobacter marensis TaxID=543877 RepID=A0A0G3X6B8_9SPHN|nr:polyhydroxyalkanoate depolymerase [Pelagerythrobacter marensis]
MNGRMVLTGRVLSGLAIAFLLFASVLPKLAGMPVASETLQALGWDGRHALLIGLIELACVILYAIPRTSVLGAVVTTALLGGAIATQMRVGSPLFTHTLFGVYLGLLIWGGLWLRNPALRALFPVGHKASDASRGDAAPGEGAHA